MFLGVGNRHNHNDAGNWRKAKKNEYDRLLFQYRRQPSAAQSCDYLYRSEGNVEENRGEGIEAK